MNVHHYTDDRHELGVTTVKKGKNEFQIYDMEKTVVDIVFYREKVGIEETKKILVTYLQRKDRNLNLLLKYAELINVRDFFCRCGEYFIVMGDKTDLLPA